MDTDNSPRNLKPILAKGSNLVLGEGKREAKRVMIYLLEPALI